MLACGCAAPRNAADEAALENDVEEIYRLIVDRHCEVDTFVLLQATTIPGPFGKPVDARGSAYLRQQAMGRLQADTLKNYRALNRVGGEVPLSESMPLSTSYTLIHLEQIEKEGWVGLKQRFSEAKALLRVSRVGFNAQRDQALVYLEATGESKTGIGVYFLLQQTGGVWEILDQMLGWIA